MFRFLFDHTTRHIRSMCVSLFAALRFPLFVSLCVSLCASLSACLSACSSVWVRAWLLMCLELCPPACLCACSWLVPFPLLPPDAPSLPSARKKQLTFYHHTPVHSTQHHTRYMRHHAQHSPHPALSHTTTNNKVAPASVLKKSFESL